MLFKMHLAFGFLIGLAAIKAFSPQNTLIFTLIVLAGSVLPNIDHPKSRIGKKIKIIGFLFEHSGFFHSLLFLALISLVLTMFFRDNHFVLPLIIGYSSHLFLDCFNHKGIMPFYPFSRIRARGFIKTGSLTETILFVFLIITDALLLLNIYG